MKDGLFVSALACAPPDLAVVENNGFRHTFADDFLGIAVSCTSGMAIKVFGKTVRSWGFTEG
jgi:hypothetical protein